MLRKKTVRNMCCLLPYLLLLCGCNGDRAQDAGKPARSFQLHSDERGEQEPQAACGPVLVAAAASLEYSLSQELIPLFEAKYPDIRVEGIYDGSGRLMNQIENGLEADLFLSAAEKQMERLLEERLIAPDSVRPLLENKLVLIVPAGGSQGYSEFADIGKAAFPALGDPESVPAGQYAKEALEALGLWEDIAARCSLGANVTEVLGWVESGSADAGLVYATDAAMTDRVEVVAEAPEGALAGPIRYPAGIVSGSGRPEAAALFLGFLRSDEAAAVFQKYGFTPVEQGAEQAGREKNEADQDTGRGGLHALP